MTILERMLPLLFESEGRWKGIKGGVSGSGGDCAACGASTFLRFAYWMVPGPKPKLDLLGQPIIKMKQAGRFAVCAKCVQSDAPPQPGAKQVVARKNRSSREEE